MIDDPEEFAWQQLEAKQQKDKAKPVTERDALKIAYNALIEIDKETPYPLAKHAAMVINEVLSRPVQDWEAIAGDQAMTIALAQPEQSQTSGYAKKIESLIKERDELRQAIADQKLADAFAEDFPNTWGKKKYTAPPSNTWVGLSEEDRRTFASWLDFKTDDEVFNAIEAALRSKNT
jgi:hypothetical protein